LIKEQFIVTTIESEATSEYLGLGRSEKEPFSPLTNTPQRTAGIQSQPAGLQSQPVGSQQQTAGIQQVQTQQAQHRIGRKSGVIQPLGLLTNQGAKLNQPEVKSPQPEVSRPAVVQPEVRSIQPEVRTPVNPTSVTIKKVPQSKQDLSRTNSADLEPKYQNQQKGLTRSTSFTAGSPINSANSQQRSPTKIQPTSPLKGATVVTSPTTVPSAAQNFANLGPRPIQRVASTPNLVNSPKLSINPSNSVKSSSFSSGGLISGIQSTPKISNIRTAPTQNSTPNPTPNSAPNLTPTQQPQSIHSPKTTTPGTTQVPLAPQFVNPKSVPAAVQSQQQSSPQPSVEPIRTPVVQSEDERGRPTSRKAENVQRLSSIKLRRTQSNRRIESRDNSATGQEMRPVSPNKMAFDAEAEKAKRLSFTNSDSGFDSQPGIACQFPNKESVLPTQTPTPVTSGPAPPPKPMSKPNVNVNALRHQRSASMDRANGQIRPEAKPVQKQPVAAPIRPANGQSYGPPIQRTSDLYNVPSSPRTSLNSRAPSIGAQSVGAPPSESGSLPPSPSMSRRAFGHGWYKEYMKETKNTFSRLGRSRSRKSSVSSQTSEASERRSHSSRSLVRSAFSHTPFNDQIDCRPESTTPHQSQTGEVIPRRKEKFQNNKSKFHNRSLDQISAENRCSMHESMVINKDVNRTPSEHGQIDVPDHSAESIHESQRTPKPIRASRAREFRRQFNTRSIDDIAKDHRKSLHQSMLPNEIIKKDFNAAQDVPDHLELHESQKTNRIKPKKEGKKRFSAIRTLFATSNEKALRGDREIHSSQIAQDDLFLSGGVFASIQDENDRNGGLRSLLILLRDGHKLNFIFQNELEKCEYEECTVNESDRNLFDKQILRFDEILDGHPKFDTEFELQDHRMMIGNLICSFDKTQRNSTNSTLRIFIRNDNIGCATVRSVNLTYPAGEKFMFEGNDVQNAFAFLSSRLKSTTVQKVQVCFREEAAPRQQNRIENGNHDMQQAFNMRSYESDFNEVEDEDVYNLLLARDRPDLEEAKQKPPKLTEIILS